MGSCQALNLFISLWYVSSYSSLERRPDIQAAQYEMVRASPTLRAINKQQQKGKHSQGLQSLLVTIEFYEDQLEGTKSADDVMRVLAREIERDGVHGVSAREREEPGCVFLLFIKL